MYIHPVLIGQTMPCGNYLFCLYKCLLSYSPIFDVGSKTVLVSLIR